VPSTLNAWCSSASGVHVATTWHCLTTPTSGSLPNQPLLHSPAPLTPFATQLDPLP
jgi:hypothetical protein